ncbi:hypothetical protein F751_5400 [Auxenochlorella protothecoides]|uniref:Uncharacterized protein n=1 Tax=Auxenochlorella protothecoides TaxID=3075 RepID=A0A087SQ31_AUXPR|nr:hypothetical protein F751_5400 [Auxenochlorella protothecoides]KFM27835.1 hypothetical protein F751_5400 [Auxenochlorella protothecoides]
MGMATQGPPSGQRRASPLRHTRDGIQPRLDGLLHGRSLGLGGPLLYGYRWGFWPPTDAKPCVSPPPLLQDKAGLRFLRDLACGGGWRGAMCVAQL